MWRSQSEMTVKEKTRYLLLLGGNTGDVASAMSVAVAALESPGLVVEKCSQVYRTAPWGFVSAHDFLNMAVIVNTSMAPRILLETLLRLEAEAGRGERNTSAYTDRPLDIDVLLWEGGIYEDARLTIPHPRMHLRRFALEPAAEIAGNWKHPLLQVTVQELFMHCPVDPGIQSREVL